MALISVAITMARQLTVGISKDVLFCWGACSWLVVVGAPTGSLFLTPGLTEVLRNVFYALAIVQFVTFAALKIKKSKAVTEQEVLSTWMIIMSCTITVFLLLGAHYTWIRKRAARSP